MTTDNQAVTGTPKPVDQLAGDTGSTDASARPRRIIITPRQLAEELRRFDPQLRRDAADDVRLHFPDITDDHQINRLIYFALLCHNAGRREAIDPVLRASDSGFSGVLQEVQTILAQSLGERQIRQWLFASNRLIKLDPSPIEAIAAGHYNAVREAAQALVDENLRLRRIAGRATE